jgi:hypothetical protein
MDLMTLALETTASDPAELDLTDPVQLDRTQAVADALLDSGADLATLRRLEGDLVGRPAWGPLVLHVAAKRTCWRRSSPSTSNC